MWSIALELRIKTRKVIQNFLTQIGILTLEKKLRRRAQFVNGLALVRSAWQVKVMAVKVRTVKVRSGIKHACFST